MALPRSLPSCLDAWNSIGLVCVSLSVTVCNQCEQSTVTHRHGGNRCKEGTSTWTPLRHSPLPHPPLYGPTLADTTARLRGQFILPLTSGPDDLHLSNTTLQRTRSSSGINFPISPLRSPISKAEEKIVFVFSHLLYITIASYCRRGYSQVFMPLATGFGRQTSGD